MILGFSITHIILFVVVVALLFGAKPFKKLGAGAGDFWKGLKRGFDNKEDIEIEARRPPADDDHRRPG